MRKPGSLLSNKRLETKEKKDVINLTLVEKNKHTCEINLKEGKIK